MTFRSILFENGILPAREETAAAPEGLTDLNLDQVINAIAKQRPEYPLRPYFYRPLHEHSAVVYRQEIMQDLENATLLARIDAFLQKMSATMRYLGLTEKLEFQYHKEGWFLEAVSSYCEAVTGLAKDLNSGDLHARGLLALRDFLSTYTSAEAFTTLLADTRALQAALATVQYCVLIKGRRVNVRKYEDEADYSQEVEGTFEKFKQGGVKDHRVKLYIGSGMSIVEGEILDRVARLYPEIFADLDRYCAEHGSFLDETIRLFDREVQFYVAYLEYIASIRGAGLPFCYPQVSSDCKAVFTNAGFDLALAHKRTAEGAPVVCNDFCLEGQERILVVSGPNQGGKTTFARMFGQLHYLASLGCPVPGTKAQLFLCDRIYTHFEREEDIQNLRGKLKDDLVRINAILRQATPHSIIIMNEIFNSTTLKDAVFLSKRIMQRIIGLDALCVCVTFIDELASLSEKTVSMVSTVVPENPAQRTYKIIRKPADGLSYALSIAEKYHLTRQSIKERIPA
jgi:DNA mismatch repair protein MutS